MDRSDLAALAGALLLVIGLASVVYAIAGELIAGGVVLVVVGTLLLVASRQSTPEAS